MTKTVGESFLVMLLVLCCFVSVVLMGRLDGDVPSQLTRPIDTCGCEKYFSNPLTSPDSLYEQLPTSTLQFFCRHGKKCNGLGDILKGVVSTFLLAVFSNHKFDLEVSKPPLADYYDFPSILANSVNTTFEIVNETEITPKYKHWKAFNHGNTNKYKSKIHEGTISEIFNTKKSYQVRTNANYIRAILESPKYPLIKQSFNTTDANVVFGCVLRFLLRPNRHLISLASSVLNKIQNPNDILIGLHIRAGSSKLKKTTPESMGSFFTCYADLLGDKLHEYYTFLATDVGAVFEIAKKYLKTSRLITDDDLTTVGHSDHCPKTRGNCDLVEQRTVVEHFLLSRVDSLIPTTSGFSKSAEWMGGFNEIVVNKEFCYCVENKTLEDFLELRNGRMVPIFSKNKCNPLLKNL